MQCSVVEMSHYPFDRSFHPGMSRTLLRLATDFRMDNRIVPWDELTGSDTIMNELAHQLRRSGWPERTYEEVRQELPTHYIERYQRRSKQSNLLIQTFSPVRHCHLLINHNEH